jgi:peptidoglycan biosynthesis protein MviN/MurJ (putative lipid II flippase)
VVLGVLQLVVAARYASDLHGGAACILYLSFLVLLVATGVVGVTLGRRST